MNTNQRSRLDVVSMIAMAAIACGVFTYVAFRAWMLSFTADEAVTYLFHTAGSWSKVIDYASVNNQPLNTLFTKLSSLAFGNSEFALRLPNVAGFAVYAAFCMLLLRRVSDWFIRIAGFLFLVSNPFLLDYFGLCRGYGLAMAFMMPALYLLFKFLEAGSNKYRFVYGALVMAAMAAMANATTLLFYASLAAIFVFVYIAMNLRRRRPSDRITVSLGAVGCRTFAVVSVVLLLLVLVVVSLYELRVALRQHRGAVPVQVRIERAADAQGIAQVERLLLRNKSRQPLAMTSEGLWEGMGYFTGLEISLPDRGDEKLSRVIVDMGDRHFEYSGDDFIRKWAMSELPNGSARFSAPVSVRYLNSQLPGMSRVLNWTGDVPFMREMLKRVARDTALVWSVSLVFLWFLLMVTRNGFLTWRQIRAMTSVTLLLGVFMAYYIHSTGGSMYYHGVGRFLPDTLDSLTGCSLYGLSYFSQERLMIRMFVFASLIAYLGFGYVWARRQTPVRECNGAVVMALLFIAAMASVVLHFVNGMPYLFTRTALFLLPLFLLAFVYLFHHLSMEFRHVWLWRCMIGLVALFACFHFYQTANLKYALEVKHDCNTRQMVLDVMSVRGNDPAMKAVGRVGLSCDWTVHAGAHFYIETWNLGGIMLSTVEKVKEFKAVDFCFLRKGSSPPTADFEAWKTYQPSGNILYRNRNVR